MKEKRDPSRRELNLMLRMKKNGVKIDELSFFDLIALRSLVRKGFAEERGPKDKILDKEDKK